MMGLFWEGKYLT